MKVTKDQLDERKLNKMRMTIFMIERENARTKQYSNTEMIKRIRKIVDEEYRANI